MSEQSEESYEADFIEPKDKFKKTQIQLAREYRIKTPEEIEKEKKAQEKKVKLEQQIEKTRAKLEALKTKLSRSMTPGTLPSRIKAGTGGEDKFDSASDTDIALLGLAPDAPEPPLDTSGHPMGESTAAAKDEEDKDRKEKEIKEEEEKGYIAWDDAINLIKELKAKVDAKRMDFVGFINDVSDISQMITPDEFEQYTQNILPILSQMTDSTGEKLFKNESQVVAFVRAMYFKNDALGGSRAISPNLMKEIRKSVSPKIPTKSLKRSMAPIVNRPRYNYRDEY